MARKITNPLPPPPSWVPVAEPAAPACVVSLDTTRPITAGIREIVITLFQAVALVILVVYIFLQNARATLIPTLTVPVSLIGTFAVFPLLGFSVNTLSLLGLVLAIGIVVDDAIVVVEAVQVNIENGLSPKEAIAQGRVKASPYVVRGRRYVPMTVAQAQTYRETGVASWYGMETYRQRGGHMTANGEAFDPNGLNAAHKHLPLPTFVRVVNLENKREIIVRVNDRGPFVDGRIIDLSAGAAKKLGFYHKGTARVLVEAVELEG